MKFINLKKWSWVLCLVLLAVPAWGREYVVSTNTTSADLKDFPEWVSTDVFGGKSGGESGSFFLGSIISNSIYPLGDESSHDNKVSVSAVPYDAPNSLDFVAGGQSDTAEVSNNQVFISNGKINSVVVGGISRIKTAKWNQVEISSDDNSVTIIGSNDHKVPSILKYPGQVIGGYVVSSEANENPDAKANAKENTVIINGGTIQGIVVGGLVQGPLGNDRNPFITTAGSGDAVGNNVIIKGGTLEYGIFGGKVGSGDTRLNTIEIGSAEASTSTPWDWSSADEVIGGFSIAGNTAGNKVKILTPVKLSTDSYIVGGWAENNADGTALGNIVDIQASVDVRHIYGGRAQGATTGNRVRLWARDDKTIQVGPPGEEDTAVSLDINAGQGGTPAGNIVEIYGNVSFPAKKVSLYGDKLILAVPKKSGNDYSLSVKELAGFKSFDIAVRSYGTDKDLVVSADKAALGTDAKIKVYSFNLKAGEALYLISADTELTGNVSPDYEDEDTKYIWGANTDGHVIKLEVTSGDARWLAVSSDLLSVASVDAVEFGEVTAGSDKPFTVKSDDSYGFEISRVRKAGKFFTVDNNTIILNSSGLTAGTEYKGWIFVDFTNGATAVAKVTAKIKQTPIPPDNTDDDSDDEPIIDDGGLPDDPTVPLPVPDAVVEEDTATVTVDIPAEQINTAIDEAIQKAAEEGSAAVPTVSIPVVVPQTGAEEIKEAKVDIALETLEAIVAKVEESAVEDVALKITAIDTGAAGSKLNVGEITLNTAALTELIAQVKESGEAASVELVITKSETKLVEEKKLTAAQVTALSEVEDDDRVFDVSLYVGQKPITTFGSGTLTIALPYTLKSGESKNYIKVYNIPESAPKVAMPTDTKETGKAIFTTTHLSVYAVIYDAPKPPEPEPEPGEGGSGGGCDAGFGAAAGLLFAAACIAARKSGKR